MGLSHKKRLRRHVEFYQTFFGFHEPFKILVDGNFVHHVRHLDQGTAEELIQGSTLKTVKLFCTPCVINELRSLGKDFKSTAKASQTLNVHKCGHRPFLSASDCLIRCIGETNIEHWWIATQDKTLREGFHPIPGVPCLFLTYNGLFLEKPSEASNQAAKETQEKAMNVSQWELRTEALKNLKQLSQNPTKSIFRKKKAKGPNPLSCLKKRKAPNSSTNEEKSTRPKRKRRKPKISTEQLSEAKKADA